MRKVRKMEHLLISNGTNTFWLPNFWLPSSVQVPRNTKLKVLCGLCKEMEKFKGFGEYNITPNFLNYPIGEDERLLKTASRGEIGNPREDIYFLCEKKFLEIMLSRRKNASLEALIFSRREPSHTLGDLTQSQKEHLSFLLKLKEIFPDNVWMEVPSSSSNVV